MSASAAFGRIGSFDTGCSPNAPRHKPVKVAIVDDEDEWRFLLQEMVEGFNEFQCVGSYRSGEAAIREVPGLSPHIVLMDIRMPGISGIECLRLLKAVRPGLIVVVVSGLADTESIREALNAGGNGYLTKPFVASQCLATLMSSMKRSTCGKRESAETTGFSGPCGGACARLTEREKEVMSRLAEGLLYKEIPDNLKISRSAFRKSQHNAFMKLHAGNRTEAIAKFVRSGRA